MTRQEANREIIKILSDVVERYPQLRFSQILTILQIIQYTSMRIVDPFYDEPQEMLERIKNAIQL